MADGAEDAAKLNFGAEFTYRGNLIDGVANNDNKCLCNAEVWIMLKAQMDVLKENGEMPNDAFASSLNHARRFSNMGGSTVEASQAKMPGLRIALEEKKFGNDEQFKLAQFEIAALVNLVPEDAEEAIVLIPSLSERLSTEEIESLLRIVKENCGTAIGEI